jgi:RNA polymerase sigma factor (sigma-70 family)
MENKNLEDKKILEQYRNLIHKLAWNVSKLESIHDDLVNIGNQCFLTLMKKYKPLINWGESVSGYVKKRITDQMRSEVVKMSWFRKFRGKYRMYYFNDTETFINYLPELIIDPNEIILNRSKFDYLINKLKNFSPVEKQIIYLIYWESLTIKEIGIKLNFSESRISQIHKGALKKLKKEFHR